MSSGKKKYSYSGDTTKIKWVDHLENEIEEILILKGRVLDIVKFVNGKRSNIKHKIKYNKNMQIVSVVYMSDLFSNVFKLQGEHALFQYDENAKPIKINKNSIKVIEGDTIPYNYYTQNFSYNASELLTSQAGDKNLLGLHFDQKNNFYNFFKDDENRLNIYKLRCSPFTSIKKGSLTHYIFDKNSNLIYYHSTSLSDHHTYSTFKEYEYFDEDETIE